MWMSPALRFVSVLLPVYFLQLSTPSDTPVVTQEDMLLAFQEVDIMDLQETDRLTSVAFSQDGFMKGDFTTAILRQTVEHLIDLEPFLTMGFTLAIASGTCILWSIHRKRLQKMVDMDEDDEDFQHYKFASSTRLGMGDACANVCNMPTETPLCGDTPREPARIRRTKRQLDMAISCPMDIVSVTSALKEEDATTEKDVTDEQRPSVEDCSAAFTIGDASMEELTDHDKGTIEQIFTLLEKFPSASSTSSLSDTRTCTASASSSSTTVISSTSTSQFVTPLTSPRDGTSFCTEEEAPPVRNSVMNLIKSEPKCRDEAIMYLEQNLHNKKLSPLHRSVLSMRLSNHRLIRENSQRRRFDIGLGLNAILSPFRDTPSKVIRRYNDDAII